MLGNREIDETAQEHSHQMCTFLVGDLFCGLPVSRVQEVLRDREMTLIPLAPGQVRGLINLRGQIVTAVDLRRTLGLHHLAVNENPMHIVVQGRGESLSFLVDGISDVLELDEEGFEQAPETLDRHLADLLQGVYKLENRLLLVLDLDKLFEYMEELD